MKFYCNEKRHTIRSAIGRKPIKIQFDNGVYETDDKSEIALLKANQYVTEVEPASVAKARTTKQYQDEVEAIKVDNAELEAKIKVIKGMNADLTKELKTLKPPKEGAGK